MAIGRSEDRDTPWNPMVLRHHHPCLGPDPRNPSGPAVIRPHHTGRTYDCNRPAAIAAAHPCETGAVHIWIPAFAVTTGKSMRALDFGIGLQPRRRESRAAVAPALAL